MPIALPKPRFGSSRTPPPRRGPTARLATPLQTQGRGLQFTELLVLGVLSFAYFISVSQPVLGVQLQLTALKHVALVMMVPVLMLHFMGSSINSLQPAWGNIFRTTWPLVLLAVYALCGSLVARYANAEQETFVTFGVYLLLLPIFAATAQSRRANAWAKCLIALWIIFSLTALSGQGARFGFKGSLHEIEYIVAVGFFAMYYVARSKLLKVLAVLLLIAAAVLNEKLTGYIVTAMALLHMVVGMGWRRLPPDQRKLYAVCALVFTAAVVAALVVLYFQFREYLPSGNPQVRLAQYESAWRQFLASPVWGTAYLGSSGEDYSGSMRVLYIPTHSDVLDMLKHGGLIAFALFTLGYTKIFLVINRAVRDSLERRALHAYFVAARFFQATALATFLINPILLKGPFVIVIWGNLGLAVGLALVTRPRFAASGQ